MPLNLSMLDEPVPNNERLSGTPLMLPAASLIEDKNNPRTTFDAEKLAELAADIQTRGILQPIIVRPAVDGVHTIMFGARRFRAGQLAGLSEFPCLIATDERQFNSYAQVAENHQRENLSPLELAAFIQDRIKAGEKKKTIADGLKITASAVTFLCALIKAPTFLIELYHAGKCTTPEYLYRLRKLHAENAELVERQVAAADEITRQWIDKLTIQIMGHQASAKLAVIDIESALPEAPISMGSDDSDHPEEQQPPAQQQPSSPPEDRSDKVKYKVIMLKHDDRPAQLLLSRRASAIGLGWIKYVDDGQEVEIELGTATLDSLIEG